MICRDTTAPSGEPGWLLISQIEHARLSGALASEWGAGDFPAVEPRDELLPAIIRHDDGWADWERKPQLDPTTGRPRDFMEMPVEDSLVIWRASIERAAALSPLGGATVAGHFLYLLRHAEVWDQHGSRAAAAAHQWSAEFEALRRAWLDEWFSQQPAKNTPAAAEAALHWLQFFDRLSLWLCMGDARGTLTVPEAVGRTLSLFRSPPATTNIDVPNWHDRQDGLEDVRVDPWPLRAPVFEITLSGRLVSQPQSVNAATLAAALVTAPRQLHNWRLRLLP